MVGDFVADAQDHLVVVSVFCDLGLLFVQFHEFFGFGLQLCFDFVISENDFQIHVLVLHQRPLFGCLGHVCELFFDFLEFVFQLRVLHQAAVRRHCVDHVHVFLEFGADFFRAREQLHDLTVVAPALRDDVHRELLPGGLDFQDLFLQLFLVLGFVGDLADEVFFFRHERLFQQQEHFPRLHVLDIAADRHLHFIADLLEVQIFHALDAQAVDEVSLLEQFLFEVDQVDLLRLGIVLLASVQLGDFLLDDFRMVAVVFLVELLPAGCPELLHLDLVSAVDVHDGREVFEPALHRGYLFVLRDRQIEQLLVRDDLLLLGLVFFDALHVLVESYQPFVDRHVGHMRSCSFEFARELFTGLLERLVAFLREFRTPLLVFLEFVLFLLGQVDDVTPPLVDVLDFEHHFDEVDVAVVLHELVVLELHEEGAAAVADGVHGVLHAVGLGADGRDALEHHAQLLDAVANLFVQVCLLLVADCLEVVPLHPGFDQQLAPEVLQVFLRLFHDLCVEVAHVDSLELLADQVVV